MCGLPRSTDWRGRLDQNFGANQGCHRHGAGWHKGGRDGVFCAQRLTHAEIGVTTAVGDGAVRIWIAQIDGDGVDAAGEIAGVKGGDGSCVLSGAQGGAASSS